MTTPLLSTNAPAKLSCVEWLWVVHKRCEPLAPLPQEAEGERKLGRCSRFAGYCAALFASLPEYAFPEECPNPREEREKSWTADSTAHWSYGFGAKYSKSAQRVEVWSLHCLLAALVASIAICCLALNYGNVSEDHKHAGWMSLWLFVGAMLLVAVAADCNELLAKWTSLTKNEHGQYIYTGSTYGRYLYWLLILGSLCSWCWPISFIVNYVNMHTWADVMRVDQFDPFDFSLSADPSYQIVLSNMNIVGMSALVISSSMFVIVTLLKTRKFATTAHHLVLEHLKCIKEKSSGYQTPLQIEEAWELALSWHYKVNDNFDLYWSAFGCGKIWVMSMLYGCLSFVTSALGALYATQGSQTQAWFEDHFVAWVVGVFFAILSLALLTSDCDKLSTVAAAMHDSTPDTKCGCAQLRHDFIFALGQTRMGAKVFGVRMDFPLLANFFAKTVVGAPAVYKVYEQIISHEKHP